MRITRPLAALALAATAIAFTAATALAADASAVNTPAASSAPKIIKWGPYNKGPVGTRATTRGVLHITGEDHAILPTADQVRIIGQVSDLATAKRLCGWAVFRISFFKKGQPSHIVRGVYDCTYGTPKRFDLTFRDVYQVELKVCVDPKLKEPSLTCRAAGTWKSLYVSK